MSDTVLDVARCLAQTRDGDEDASRELVRHLYPLIMKIVRGHLPKRMEEEDLAQAIFVKIFNHLGQYKGAVPLEHWVSRIAVNTCLNQLRAENIRPELRWADLKPSEAEVLERVLTTSQEPGPADQLASRDLVEKLLSTLNPADRSVITMLELEDRSIEEIKALTGWSASLIKVRAFRARHKLKKEFRKLVTGDI
jgi:RNA polymerase sigma-70 factor (ECF subfamily)